ncbi:Iron-sulfur cluster-binding protein [uncultured Gammaproteobacteria bacterium]|jgi:ferredoxin|nr:Iron-sulfur cluster-binding protein [uncultured Gammaproteobacteria bacterium]CAC9576511.1 Iron-sulfur cluster-binding protein [uncultured Gammaproteobacteria bacterium]
MTVNTNNQAKQQAISALEEVWINPASLVSYHSSGFILIVATSIERAQSVANQLSTDFTPYYLLRNQTKKNIDNITYGNLTSIGGYLGSFEISAQVNNENKILMAEDKYFDIVLDLIGEVETAIVPPFGYYTLDKNTSHTEEVLTEVNQLIGILDKPKFLNLDTSLCVHNRNKTELCQRCIDVCPADAIRSNGDYVEANINLCHGCGGCSSVCPTGAISYAYPTIDDQAKKMHSLMSTYLNAGGTSAKILFHSADNLTLLPHMMENVLPIALEEVGCLGLESFLYAFCLGAESVIVHCADEPTQTLQALDKQTNLMHKILSSLGYNSNASFVQLVEQSSQISDGITPLNNTIGMIDLYNKRMRIFAMIDFLYHYPNKNTLSQCDFTTDDDAYFGEVLIDEKLCTLCMACTSVCPTKALSSGDINTPIINFQESLCVQCGLCVKSCPENAMQLNARLVFSDQQRSDKRSLNQDEPFKCIDCGKVFGSTQVVKRMMEKLKGHSMFTDNKLINLEKCEDCRVKALFE